MPLPAFFLLFKKPSPGDRYRIVAMTSAEELADPHALPVEVQYVLAKRPEFHSAFHRLLKEGYGIGVRTVERTPGRILLAADRIAEHSQENTIVPWLPTMLQKEEIPVFTREEVERTREKEIDLYKEAKLILDERHEFRKIVLIDLHNRRIHETDQAFMQEVNNVLYPLSVHAIVHRVVIDRSRTRPKTGEGVLKSALFIGPIAHVLEWWVLGLGKVFAALADDVLSEIAELVTLRQSGFTKRQLSRRAWTLAPVFILVTYGAFQVEPLLETGHPALGGAVFGLCAVVLSLTTSLQSIGMYRAAYAKLVRARKMTLAPGQTLWSAAMRQDFMNPARLGFFLGALLTPAIAALVFTVFNRYTSNGWLLAFTASATTLIATGTVLLSEPVEKWWLKRQALAEVKKCTP